jgi:hypothetical protein
LAGATRPHNGHAPPSLPEARAQRTLVVVRFEPTGDKRTRVVVHHTGWGDGGEWDMAFAYLDRAWGHVLGNLKKRFDDGPQDWTAWVAQLKAWREQQAAASSPQRWLRGRKAKAELPRHIGRVAPPRAHLTAAGRAPC